MKTKKISMKKLSEAVGITQPHLTCLLTGMAGFGIKSITLLNRCGVGIEPMLDGDYREVRRQLEKKYGAIVPWTRR